MKNDPISSDVASGIWKFFASLQLTIVLLFSLAVTSVIGTLIPQNESPAAYFRAFGPFFFRLFEVLDLFDMYHSWWFQILIVFLTANVLICSVDRLSATWKIIFVREPRFNADRFQRQKSRREFFVSGSPESLKDTIRSVAPRGFGRVQIQEQVDGFALFAERWRWSRLGVYIVHTSVLLLLIGGLIGSLFGFEGFVNIPEGESAEAIQLRKTGETVRLPFSLRCDDFSVSFYSTGEPKEYRSRLTILEGGKETLQQDILVNHPLRYKGINIFQASFGEMESAHGSRPEPRSVTLTFTSRETGMVYEQKMAMGAEVQVPEGGGTFVLDEFRPEATFMGQPIGEALVGRMIPSGGKPVEVLLPLRFANFDKMRKGRMILSVVATDPPPGAAPEKSGKRYYTGLQVTRDPGVWVVYTGFILMIAGCFVTFFMSHQQICVAVSSDPRGSRVMVAGTASRNRMAMENGIERLADRLNRAIAGRNGPDSGLRDGAVDREI